MQLNSNESNEREREVQDWLDVDLIILKSPLSSPSLKSSQFIFSNKTHNNNNNKHHKHNRVGLIMSLMMIFGSYGWLVQQHLKIITIFSKERRSFCKKQGVFFLCLLHLSCFSHNRHGLGFKGLDFRLLHFGLWHLLVALTD